MSDIVSVKKRSQMMAGIRSKNTSPEKTVRSLLFGQGFRYRLHRKDLPAKPDLVLKKYSAVILVHGCFWHLHDCSLSKIPSSNHEFWRAKLCRNKERDREQIDALRALGWRVGIVWECATRTRQVRPSLAAALRKWLTGTEPNAEFSRASLGLQKSTHEASSSSHVQ